MALARMHITVPFGTEGVQSIVQGNGDARHQQPVHGLHALLHSTLEHVLPLLGLRGLRALAGASSHILRACADDSLWTGLCWSAWGVAGDNALLTYNVACFRALYAVLSAFGPLLGVYVSLDDYPYGNVLRARFDNGEFIAENLVPDEDGGRARLFAVRFSQTAASALVTATTLCFHHHKPGSRAGHVVGRAARLRLVSRPQKPIAPSGVFSARVVCCSQLVVSPEQAVLQVLSTRVFTYFITLLCFLYSFIYFTHSTDTLLQMLFNKSCPEVAIDGTWFMGLEDEEEDGDGAAASVAGRPCRKLAELLSIGVEAQEEGGNK
jgi:hypothetical protein